MQRGWILFLAAIFLSSSDVAFGKQASSAPAIAQAGTQTSADTAQDCRRDAGSLRDARQAPGSDLRAREVQSDPVSESETVNAAPPAVNLDRDLKILWEKHSGL